MELSATSLAATCGDDTYDAGISIRSTLEPLAGRFAPVKPATYAGGEFQDDERWRGTPPERTSVVVIDNVPSQANRIEAELLRLREPLGLPEVVLDLSCVASLPPHLPRELSGFRFPHRHADAYLRDAMAGDTPFWKTPTGAALFNATANDPRPILGWFPQAALFGWWQSHLGSKRSQSKLPRSWVSEIAGYGPASDATTRTRSRGLKGDDLNLSITEKADFIETDAFATPWSIDEGSKKEKVPGGQSRKALSELGHGQVPFRGSDGALSGISFLEIEQRATVSFAGLRRLHFGDTEDNAVARALLVSLGLVGHTAAFGRAFTLRSGCDLRSVGGTWSWLGANGPTDIDALNVASAITLFRDCQAAAERTGLLRDGGWAKNPLRLTPAANLASAIAKSWPLAPIGA